MTSPLTPEEREAFYDEHIAPKLLELCQLANANDMGFVAAVEFNPDQIARTSQLTPGHCFHMLTVLVALKVGRNVDTLIGFLVNEAETRGHGSVYLKMLGVPERPKPRLVTAPDAG